jgi:hypothetical protein
MAVLLVVEKSAEQLREGGQPPSFVLRIERYQLRRPDIDGLSAIGASRAITVADGAWTARVARCLRVGDVLSRL